MLPKIRGVVTLGCALLLPSLARGGEGPRLADDGYHYEQFRDGAHDGRYVEWWYFNLVDPSAGLNLAFTYSIVDPDNRTGFGTTGLVAATLGPGAPLQSTYFLPADRFHGTPTSADLVVDGAGAVEVIDDETYRVWGAIPGDRPISWDLTYSARSAPWLGGADEMVGLHPWEKMSWLVYMPAAVVSGEVVLGGEVHRVTEAAGYHDHNFGEWVLNNVTWNWAQCTAPGLDLELGDFIRRPVGVLSVSVDGERLEFDKGEYAVLHTRWEHDAGTGRSFPTQTRLVARNRRASLYVVLGGLETTALLPPPEIPFLFVKPVIFEQLVECSGAVRWRHEHGGSKRRRFRGAGFREYAVRTAARSAGSPP